jgi:hypothetical protein
MKLGILGFTLIYPPRCCNLWSLNPNVRIENIRRVYNATFRGVLGRRNSAKVHFRVTSFHGVSADVSTMTSLYFIRVFNSL